MFKNHPKGLPVLFFTEMWERFGFYLMLGIFVLYMRAGANGVFPAKSGLGLDPATASDIYGTYIALVYLTPFVGGLLADRILGYRRSIIIGGVLMGLGYCGLAIPGYGAHFFLSLLFIIIGNGFFKPNISTMVGKLYSVADERRDSGFTLFYMGINLGAMVAPILTGWLASKVFGTEDMPAYKVVFIASGIGMLVSLVWFWFGRRQLQGVGRPNEGGENKTRVLYTAIGALLAIPVIYFLLSLGASTLQWILTAMFLGLGVLLLVLVACGDDGGDGADRVLRPGSVVEETEVGGVRGPVGAVRGQGGHPVLRGGPPLDAVGVLTGGDHGERLGVERGEGLRLGEDVAELGLLVAHVAGAPGAGGERLDLSGGLG